MNTGGDSRSGLIAARDAPNNPSSHRMVADWAQARAECAQGFLFAYPTAPVAPPYCRLGSLGHAGFALPETPALRCHRPSAQCGPIRAGTRIVRGNHLAGIPFLAQEAYDRLLWACDLNFVRGEDSFVQFNGPPSPWYGRYTPHDAAHEAKLEAFITRYTGG